jgi:hypothetical protein
MTELLELLDAGPMIALAIACVLMISVVVVVILQARRIGRLERRLAERGESAEEVSLQRIAELQARHETSLGGGSGIPLRPALAVGAVLLVVVLALGGTWMLVRDGDDGGAQAEAAGAQADTATTAANGEPREPQPTQDPTAATTVPATVPPISDTSAFSVKVFNASGVPGAAGDGVAPRLTTEGYNVLRPDNYPTGETDVAESVVMYNGRANQAAAWNIARVLDLDRSPPLEGLTVDQIDGADVVVVVGTDLARNMTSSATP